MILIFFACLHAYINVSTLGKKYLVNNSWMIYLRFIYDVNFELFNYDNEIVALFIHTHMHTRMHTHTLHLRNLNLSPVDIGSKTLPAVYDWMLENGLKLVEILKQSDMEDKYEAIKSLLKSVEKVIDIASSHKVSFPNERGHS